MILRRSMMPLRRLFSSSANVSTGKLPFEKPIFESPLLDKARAETDSLKRLKFYLDVGVIIATGSVFARLTYYIIYGKQGGAAPLPRRHETMKEK